MGIPCGVCCFWATPALPEIAAKFMIQSRETRTDRIGCTAELVGEMLCGVLGSGSAMSAWQASILTNETERRTRPIRKERDMPVNRKQTQRLLPSRVTNPAALIILPSSSNDDLKTVRAGNVLTESGAR